MQTLPKKVLATFTIVSCLFLSSAALSQSEAENPWRMSVAGSGAEQKELTALLSTTLSVLESEAFEANLKAAHDGNELVRDIVTKSGNTRTETITIEDLISIIRRNKENFWKFSQSITLVGTYWKQGNMYYGECYRSDGSRSCSTAANEVNNLNRLAANRGLDSGADTPFEIVIGRSLHKRYRSTDPFKKSCAVNTLAHEILHGFARGNATWYHQNYFVDTGSDGSLLQSDLPTSTYYFGTVAQCTWLQREGHVQANTNSLKACVARYGIKEFLSNQCDEN